MSPESKADGSNVAATALAVLLLLPATLAHAVNSASPDVSVGPQYDSTHVYVAPADMNAFVAAFTATFGGKPSPRVAGNVLPVPSHTAFQFVLTPVGTLSVFGFDTPVPFPFGSERTGYLVRDMDTALTAARASGSEILVARYRDPIGLDAVVRWPGGFETQLYWHFAAPHYAPLASMPDSRVYVSPDRADEFLRDFLRFSRGTIVSDDHRARAGEIGRPGAFYRRVRVASGFGRMQVLVTDGHLPYPFGRELTGYQVGNIAETLVKAKAAGVRVLSPPYASDDRVSAMLQFPGGYIAEVHALKSP